MGGFPSPQQGGAGEGPKHEESTIYRSGGEGHSSRSHSIPHSVDHDQLHGTRTAVLKLCLTEQEKRSCFLTAFRCPPSSAEEVCLGRSGVLTFSQTAVSSLPSQPLQTCPPHKRVWRSSHGFRLRIGGSCNSSSSTKGSATLCTAPKSNGLPAKGILCRPRSQLTTAEQHYTVGNTLSHREFVETLKS